MHVECLCRPQKASCSWAANSMVPSLLLQDRAVCSASHGCCQLLFPQELSTSSLTSVPLLAWFSCVWISKMLGCEAQNCCWNSHSVEFCLKLKSILNLWYIFDLIFFVVAYISGSMQFFSMSTFPGLNAVRFLKCFLLGKLYEELK